MLNSRHSELYRHICFIIISGIIACCIAYVSVEKQKIYFERYPFFTDPSADLYRNIEAHEKFKESGRIETITWVWQNNFRSPLRIIIPVLLYPDALTSPYGDLITSTVFLWIFVYSFSTLVYRQSNSILIVGSACILLATLPLFYNTRYGFAAYQLDTHASFLVITGIVLLVFYFEKQRIWLLIGFASVSGLAFLSRNYSSYFLLFTGLPILLATLIFQRHNIKHLMVHYLVLAVILCLVTGDFMIKHFQDNLEYARELGYGSGFPLLESIRFNVQSIIKVLGQKTIALLIIYSLFFVVLNRGVFFGNKPRLALFLWCGFSSALFLMAVFRTGAHIPSVVYIILSAITFCLIPISLSMSSERTIRVIAGSFILMSGLFVTIDYRSFKELRSAPKTAEKQMDEAIVAAIKGMKGGKLSAFVGGYSITNTAIESYFAKGALLKPVVGFSKYDLGWYYEYKTKDIRVIKSELLKKLESEEGLILSFAAKEDVDNYISRASKPSSVKLGGELATMCIEYFKHSREWKVAGTYSHPFYGNLVLYSK